MALINMFTSYLCNIANDVCYQGQTETTSLLFIRVSLCKHPFKPFLDRVHLTALG
jgi:hypothetical protein